MTKPNGASAGHRGAEQTSLERARAEIRERVANFRRHQAELQASREARWDRVSAETRTKVQRMFRG